MSKKKCVVVWKNEREVLVYPPFVETEEEALRKAAGVFVKILRDQSVFAKARNEASVYWDGSREYDRYLPLARKFRQQYEVKRDTDNARKTLAKIERANNPFPAFTARKKKPAKVDNPNQSALF